MLSRRTFIQQSTLAGMAMRVQKTLSFLTYDNKLQLLRNCLKMIV